MTKVLKRILRTKKLPADSGNSSCSKDDKQGRVSDIVRRNPKGFNKKMSNKHMTGTDQRGKISKKGKSAVGSKGISKGKTKKLGKRGKHLVETVDFDESRRR